MITVPFDELDVVARRLADARAALTTHGPVIPTDSGTLASDVLAAAAASFERSMTRRKRAADAAWDALRAGVVGAAGDFREFEQSAAETLRAMESAL